MKKSANQLIMDTNKFNTARKIINYKFTTVNTFIICKCLRFFGLAKVTILIRMLVIFRGKDKIDFDQILVENFLLSRISDINN